MSTLAQQVGNLDAELFSFVEAQSPLQDRQALLALHAAAADLCHEFAYLEIGSYLGGSLQALIRDARCRSVISIDLRTAATPDARGGYTYEENSTEHMLELLRSLPGAEVEKLTTFDVGTANLATSDLLVKPDYCFIDGEHTHDAVLRDAHFCADAINGVGVIAFHDYVIVGSAISDFLRQHWREISFALAFGAPSHPSRGGGVFALEMGGRGLLKHPAIDRAIGSRWHSIGWRIANRPPRIVLPFLLTWAIMPAIDSFVVQARHGLQEYVRR